MPRFFCDTVLEDTILLTGEDAVHLSRSLRVRVGEEVTVCDGKKTDYRCVVESVSPDTVALHIEETCENRAEPPQEITLYQALPKGDKLDFIVQKAVEMGAARIVPVQTRFCVAKSDAKSFEKKRVRLQKIALEAAKQSGRGIVPEVCGLLSFKEAAAQLAAEKGMVCYEHGGEPIGKLMAEGAAASLFIGSEGGFAEEEIAVLNENGVRCASLGVRILRCETAPIAALALISHALGEM